MDVTRSALIVASYDYDDPGLRQLRAPARDAEALARVLSDPGIGGYEVRTLRNEPEHVIREAVEEFFADRRPDDLLLLSFTGHGVKSHDGELYLAASDTKLRRLAATALPAEFVSRCMSRSRSRRVVLLLDCCYAGAFERGLVARAGNRVDVEEHFGGRGRAVITASSAVEYAFEGVEVADRDEGRPSVFTGALVEGLETGEADRDQDGYVGLDELYDYVFDRVRAVTPNQTPGKWTFGVEGQLRIAARARPVTEPAPLPSELRQAIEHPLAGVRRAAVTELERWLRGAHAGQALAARLALARMAGDDSRTVGAAAAAALGAPPRPGLGEPDLPAAPAAAVPAPAVDAPPSGTDQGGDRIAAALRDRVAVAGPAAAGAALMLAGVLAPYKGATRIQPLTTWPELAGYFVATAVVVLATVACLFVTRSGPGLVLGAAAAASWGLVAVAGDVAWPLTPTSAGIGWGIELVAQLLVLGAAGLVLALHPGARLVPGLPRDPLGWLVVALGAVGAAGLIGTVAAGLGSVHASGAGAYLTASGWAAVVALGLPLCAALVAPRRFGAALLAGWAAGGLAIVLYHSVVAARASHLEAPGGQGGIATFALSLVGLAAVAVPFARSSPSPSRGRVRWLPPPWTRLHALAGGAAVVVTATLVAGVVLSHRSGGGPTGSAGSAAAAGRRGVDVSDVAFSPDGGLLAAGGSRGVWLWDLTTDRPATSQLTGNISAVSSLAFSPDGKILAVADLNGVRLWDSTTGQEVPQQPVGPTGGLESLTFSPDGRTLATGGFDPPSLWDIATGHQIRSMARSGRASGNRVSRLAFSPDGRTLAALTGEDIELWDPATGQRIDRAFPGVLGEGLRTSLAFSPPDGRILASGYDGGYVHLWDAATGRLVGQALRSTGPVAGLAFSPDGKLLATGDRDSDSVRLWDPATSQPVGQPLTSNTQGVTAVAFSPDGRVLATAGYSGRVLLLNVATGAATELPAVAQS